MTKSYTTMGIFTQPNTDGQYFTGPSMSREEQLNRLTALRKVKGLSESKQHKLGESIFKQ